MVDKDTDPDPRGATRLLCVDDDPETLEVLSEILTKEGYDVSTARSPEQGRRMLELNHFSALVTDYEMPRQNGVDLVRAARRAGLMDDTAVVLYSGREKAVGDEDLFFVEKPMRHVKPFLTLIRYLCARPPMHPRGEPVG
jgi:CheY-like chemotaxis protein